VISRTVEYFQPRSVEEAVEVLARHKEAKILAGGQSLIPMLTMRLAHPSALIDIGRIPTLRYIRRDAAELAIGALVRHQDLVTSDLVRDLCPLLADAARHIGHLHIRNRGTIGGSLAHADPAAEYTVAGFALGATVTVVGTQGARTLALDELIIGPLTTSLGPDELITEVRVPVRGAGVGWGFREFVLRQGDFALVSTAVLLTRAGATGRVEEARICVGAATDVPTVCRHAEQGLRGEAISPELAATAGRLAASELKDVVSDIHAPAEYRTDIAAVLVRDALLHAWGGGR
jgi:carbon-monoxide dehydrogenase medium subunit